MKKKTLSIALALVMLMSAAAFLTSCGDKEEEMAKPKLDVGKGSQATRNGAQPVLATEVPKNASAADSDSSDASQLTFEAATLPE